MTAPGVPVIGAGFNGHGVAWGVTTGASDTDDLYAERLAGEGSEQYYFRGQSCGGWTAAPRRCATTRRPATCSRSGCPRRARSDVRLCRTVHGPVQARAGGVAYARRYAGWMRELETLEGLAGRQLGARRAGGRRGRPQDDLEREHHGRRRAGHIGYWHPGLHPLRARRWDERLPLPGTGEAEWRGLLDRSRIPSVIDPEAGLAGELEQPAVDRLDGGRRDGPQASRRAVLPRRAGCSGSRATPRARRPSRASRTSSRQAGTVAQQHPIATARLRRAARGAEGGARQVLDTLLAWDGSYHRTDAAGTVDPGVAAWDAFRAAAAEVALARFGEAAGGWPATTPRPRSTAAITTPRPTT